MGARRIEPESLSGQIADALREMGVVVPNKKKTPPSDDELRDRWIVAHPHTAIGLGEFRRYRDGYWPTIHNKQVKQEIVSLLQAAKGEGIVVNSHKLNSVFALAETKIFVPDDEWDAKKNILVMLNGTLDITSRRLRKHAPSDYSTIALDYSYDPSAHAPSWEYYLDSTLPDVKCFLQEFAGYCLTTDTQYEIALWFVGERGSGKSTGVLGFQTMLGPKVGRLGLANIERSQFALFDLPGKNLCIATEQPAMYMKSSDVLNAIISGEPVTVEKKFKDSYTFTPHTKILWSMNSLPRVADTTDGIFRRVKVVRFASRPVAQHNTSLKDSIASEGAGILNWALDGLERLRQRGKFLVPQCVQEATERYQETNDIPAHYVADACTRDWDAKTQSNDLYASYKQWALDNGHKPQSATSMAEEWERLGFQRYRANGRTFYRGVRLNGLLEQM